MFRNAIYVLLALVCGGCRYGEMYDQPRYEAYDPSDFFPDGNSSRPLEPGVVPWNPGADVKLELTRTTGKASDGAFVDALPFPLEVAALERGQNRYRIYCAPCHGLDGAGRGPIVERGFSPPPSLSSDEVRNHPVGYYFDVITHGHGAMYGYAARIPIDDRWKIAAYLRALQLSQSASLSDLTDKDRERLENQAAAPNSNQRSASATESHP